MEEINIDLIFFKHTGAHVNSRIYAAIMETCLLTIKACSENVTTNKADVELLRYVEVDKKSILDTKNQIV